MKAYKEEEALYQLGDRVRIRLSNGLRGRIIELRGALGPGGAQIYRVRAHYGRGDEPSDIEVREDQLILLKTATGKSDHNGEP